MRPEDQMPGTPEDWLRHARSDLALAQVRREPAILVESLCFHAQQAAEKAIKAVLVSKGIAFPRTHNIRTLLDLLPADIIAPQEVTEASALTDHAVLNRYPANAEPVPEEEYLSAVATAQAVVDWADETIGR